MIILWVGVGAAALQCFVSEMNAMKNLMRSLIALTAFVTLMTFGGGSIAAITSAAHKSSTETNLSKAGFLDFKTIIYSPSTGDNLAGVFNQIKFIGPNMFRNAALPPGALQKFKRSQSPLLPANPVWGWDESDLGVLNSNINGKLPPVSSELADAILMDIKDHIRNHGVTLMINPAIGPGTTAYFNSATQQIIDQIDALENGTTAAPAISQDTPAAQPITTILHPQPVLFFGLGLITIGLLRRRSRRKSPEPARKPADPASCFAAIRNSPIRHLAKTA